MRVFKAGDEIGGVTQVTTVKSAKDYRHEAGIDLVSKRLTEMRTSIDGALIPIRFLRGALQIGFRAWRAIPAYLTAGAVHCEKRNGAYRQSQPHRRPSHRCGLQQSSL